VKAWKERLKSGAMKIEQKFSLDLQMNFAFDILTSKTSKFGKQI